MIPSSRLGEKALRTLTKGVWVRPRSDLYSLEIQKNLSLSERIKGIRIQVWTDSLASRKLRHPEVPNNRYMKVVMSALHTGRLYRPEIPWYSCRPQGDSEAGRNNSNGNRTRDLLDCSAVSLNGS